MELEGRAESCQSRVTAALAGCLLTISTHALYFWRLEVRRVITHRFKVAEFEAGFAAMRSGQSGKVVLDWG